jgi:nucleotide-binding universal stress UspA family protein
VFFGGKAVGMNTPESAVEKQAPVDSAGHERARIVVGIDGSDSSVAALKQALRLAQAFDASLEAIIVWSYPIALTAYAVPTLPDLERAARDAATAAINRVFDSSWPDWLSLKVREGNSAHVLMTESIGAEMLVLGSRGHGGFAGLLLGSVSAECAEHAQCPVLVVHENPAQSSDEHAEK